MQRRRCVGCTGARRHRQRHQARPVETPADVADFAVVDPAHLPLLLDVVQQQVTGADHQEQASLHDSHGLVDGLELGLAQPLPRQVDPEAASPGGDAAAAAAGIACCFKGPDVHVAGAELAFAIGVERPRKFLQIL